MLDGEGGATVWGKLVPARRSLDESLLPIGLAQDISLRRDISAGEALRWADVVIDDNDPAVRIRRAMENTIGPEGQRETAA